MSSELSIVKKRIEEFDVFVENQNANYLKILNLVGGDTFKNVSKKYGIPIARFGFELGDNIVDNRKEILGVDRDYFEKFDSYRKLFPETDWTLNHNRSVVSTKRELREGFFRKDFFQREKDYIDERFMYFELCAPSLVNFGKIKLPFDYLWENRGKRFNAQSAGHFDVTVSKLRLHLESGNITSFFP